MSEVFTGHKDVFISVFGFREWAHYVDRNNLERVTWLCFGAAPFASELSVAVKHAGTVTSAPLYCIL